jgi:hypothetical protein
MTASRQSMAGGQKCLVAKVGVDWVGVDDSGPRRLGQQRLAALSHHIRSVEVLAENMADPSVRALPMCVEDITDDAPTKSARHRNPIPILT